MELEESKQEFAARGLNVAGLSHDNVAILDYFAKRKGITYPLLADADGRAAFALGIANHNYGKGHELYGLPFPGTFILYENGVVQAKFFEENHRERYTASHILVNYFHDAAGQAVTEVTTKHLTLKMAASDGTVRAGNRVALVVEVKLNPRMHVYAPEVEGGYIPVSWQMPDSTGWVTLPVSYPPSKTMRLEAIKETVPVYEGSFRLTRDIVLGQNKDFRPLTAGNSLKVQGLFRYQACDEKMCYPPATRPLEWNFETANHDTQDAPKELKDK